MKKTIFSSIFLVAITALNAATTKKGKYDGATIDGSTVTVKCVGTEGTCLKATRDTGTGTCNLVVFGNGNPNNPVARFDVTTEDPISSESSGDDTDYTYNLIP